MNRKFSLFLIIFFFFISILSFPVHSQEGGNGEQHVPSHGEILGMKWSWVMCNILCVLFFLSGTAAAVVIAVSGIKYAVSESSVQRDESRRRIMYAVAALILVISAIGIINYVVSSVDTGARTFECWCTSFRANSSATMPDPHANMTGIPLGVEITYPGEGSQFLEGTTIQLSGMIYGGSPGYTYEWTSSPGGVHRSVSKSASFDSFRVSLAKGDYTIKLIATDGAGRTGEDSVEISVVVPKPDT